MPIQPRNIFLFLCGLLITLVSCQTAPVAQPYGNPPASGFNAAASDEKAIAIADEVMEAMGGREAWDSTDRIFWNFFGSRTLDWNKAQNTVVVNSLRDSMTMDLNMNDSSGSVVIKGETVSDPDTLAKYLTRAKNVWINDSYWLVMPFKLKDSGVTLKYVGRDSTAAGQAGDKLALTFDKVGVTPQNKYEVIVTDDNRLVEEWRFYTNATDSVPRFTTPWADYKKYGDIMLSGDRGRNKLTEIRVGAPQ